MSHFVELRCKEVSPIDIKELRKIAKKLDYELAENTFVRGELKDIVIEIMENVHIFATKVGDKYVLSGEYYHNGDNLKACLNAFNKMNVLNLTTLIKKKLSNNPSLISLTEEIKGTTAVIKAGFVDGERVIYTIESGGTIGVETSGFIGGECQRFSNIKDVLGETEVIQKKLKTEYYLEKNTQEKVVLISPTK